MTDKHEPHGLNYETPPERRKDFKLIRLALVASLIIALLALMLLIFVRATAIPRAIPSQ